MKLYEVSNCLRDLLCNLNDEGGELTDAEIELIDSLQEERGRKIDGICAIITEWRAHIAVRKAEVDRLRAGIATLERNEKRLKEYLQANLEKTGEREYQSPLWKIWVQKNPVSLQPVDEDASKLPAEYQRISIEADREKAREYFKANGQPPAGFTANQSTSLRIR